EPRMVAASTHGRDPSAQPASSRPPRMTPSSQGARPNPIIAAADRPAPKPPIVLSWPVAYLCPHPFTQGPRCMIGRLNHGAMAVGDIAKAAATYRETLGAEVSAATAQPEHGVTTVFINLPNTKIELLEPYGEGSPIAKFLERNPDGGIHHLCYEVDDIRAARDTLKAPA